MEREGEIKIEIMILTFSYFLVFLQVGYCKLKAGQTVDLCQMTPPENDKCE